MNITTAHEWSSGAARSTLHRLSPLGVGTALAESMESYVLRLSSSHRVARYHVERMVADTGGEQPIYDDSSLQPPRLDAPTHEALIFGQRLAALTGEPRTLRLGLGWLAGRISHIQTLRSHRAWCPDCFRDALREGSPPYLQLAWSLVLYQCCLVHQRPLVSRCPHCNRGSAASRRWSSSALSRCANCGGDLAVDLPESIGSSQAKHEPLDPIHMNVATLLGELVARTRTISEHDPIPGVKRAQDSAIDRGRVLNSAELARRCDLAKSTVHTLANDPQARPSLDALTRIALVADVSLVGMIDASQWHTDLFAGPVPCLTDVFKRRVYKRSNWQEIHVEVEQRLSAGERIPSVAALARTHDLDPSHMAVNLGSLTPRLREQARQHKQSIREEAVAQTETKIANACQRLWREGKKPSAKQVAHLLGMGRTTSLFKTAWQRAQRRPSLFRPEDRRPINPHQLSLGL